MNGSTPLKMVAVLTSGPGIDDSRTLFNDEMVATRRLIDGLAGSGRLLTHAVVHADLDYEVDAMAEWTETMRPAGWKVYTPGRIGPDGWTSGWQLDDHEYGFPFLERARALGVPLICAHKGISLILVEADSPGFVRGRNLDKLGLRGQDTSELFFEECRVPATNLLGPRRASVSSS